MKALPALALTLLAGCSAPVTTASFETLGPDIEPLRTAFNAARGQVRAVILASPT
jgi:hypothetical protein